MPAPWSGAQRLIRIDLNNPDDIKSIEPFGTPGGGIIAPPVYVPESEMAITWDSINGGLAGVSDAGGELEVVWHFDARPTMQPVVFPGSKELVINDFVDSGDDLIVIDIESGELSCVLPLGNLFGHGRLEFLILLHQMRLLVCRMLSLSPPRRCSAIATAA